MIQSSLSGIKVVDRVSYICNLCKGKKVLHLGATDAPVTKEAIVSGRLLHNFLNDVCQEVVGLDISLEMINWLESQHGIKNIKYGNIEEAEHYPQGEFDYIVAGEILEHLSNPGNALDAIRRNTKNNTKLIITVPNAYSFKGFVRAVGKHELIHPDHILHHSPYTLKALLERHGFSVESYFSFVNGGQGLAASVANWLLYIYPQLAEGIGVICVPQ
jgi:2-polyprenyl-3-methyl-5-hydroxy-6-metoxy-1,4-benzoquinol methylase